MNPLPVINLSKHEPRLIADMRGIKMKRNIEKKNELFKILKKYDKTTYNESSFKSIILDIRSILPKKGCRTIKKVLNMLKK